MSSSESHSNSLQQTVNFGLLIAMILVLMIVGQMVIAPLVFAVILTMALTPACNWMEEKGLSRLWAIVLTFVGIAVTLSVILVLVSITFANVIRDLPEIQSQIEKGLVLLNKEVNDIFGVSNEDLRSYARDHSENILSQAWGFVEELFNSSIVIVGNIFLTLLYVFFLLLYRKGIKKVLTQSSSGEFSKSAANLLSKVKDVVRSYAFGLLIVILLLGTVNSIGLWMIGIDYAFFWGYLAGLMTVIPYIGTTLGGFLPFLYALATTDTIWQPAAIVIMYFSIQQLEGNLITPNIVGSQMNVNPLAVIIALIVGALIWGIAGMILSLPAVGILRVVLMHNPSTHNLGLILSGSISNKE
jgi:predicted PurR-regulated permease PerM